MRMQGGARLLRTAYLLLLSLSSCLPAQKVTLGGPGDCPPPAGLWRVTVEGYFGVGADQSVSTHGGYESSYPYARFPFSAEPGVKSKFAAAVVWAGQGLNGPERTNRTELAGSGNERAWVIYDNQGWEIKVSDKVRVTGRMIEPCVVRADKIEKL